MSVNSQCHAIWCGRRGGRDSWSPAASAFVMGAGNISLAPSLGNLTRGRVLAFETLTQSYGYAI